MITPNWEKVLEGFDYQVETDERYDSSWGLQYMKRLEKDKTVAKWTKNHGITIQHVTEAGNVRGYRPDFLIERIDGAIELREVKGGQYLNNLDTNTTT